MSAQNSAESAARRFSQLAEDLHRRAQDDKELRRFVRTGRRDLDAAIERVLDGSRELSEAGIEIAASAAAACTARVFEEGTP